MPNSKFVRGIQRPEPHILTVYGNHPFYLDPTQRGIWRRGTPFDEDERQLQYLSFTQPFNTDTILRPVHSWDNGNGGISKNGNAQHYGRKQHNQERAEKTNYAENKEPSTAEQSAPTIQAKSGRESIGKIAKSGPVQEQSGSWLMNTIASLSKGTAKCTGKKISLAEYKAKSQAPKKNQNISGNIPKQEIATAGIHEEKLRKKRPFEDVVGSDTKDTSSKDLPYSDAKRARSSPKPEVILIDGEREPCAPVSTYTAPSFYRKGSANTAQGGATSVEKIPAARDQVELKFEKEKNNVSATEAPAKAAGSVTENEVRVRKRPLEVARATDATTTEPATKKRAIGAGIQLPLDSQGVASKPKILTPKKIQPTRPGLKNTGSSRDLPPLLSPTLPDWVEEEVAKRQATGATAPKSPLSPLRADQKFEKNVANTPIAVGEPRRAVRPKIYAPQNIQCPGLAPKNTGSSRDLPPLLSPTLPDWIEKEVTRRQVAGATALKSILAPLWTDQEFENKSAITSVTIEKPRRATKQKCTAAEGSETQSKPARPKGNTASKTFKSNPFIEYLRRGKRFG